MQIATQSNMRCSQCSGALCIVYTINCVETNCAVCIWRVWERFFVECLRRWCSYNWILKLKAFSRCLCGALSSMWAYNRLRFVLLFIYLAILFIERLSISLSVIFLRVLRFVGTFNISLTYRHAKCGTIFP